MASNPFLACDSVTGWYRFTPSLSWSNNCGAAQVLSDIPFISMGTLVFGVSALFLLLKRASLPAAWLFVSALLAFIAAVLDLGHALADETIMNMTLAAHEPAIRAREVLFAFSVGFRFLFFWSYVAEPPLKARCVAAVYMDQRIMFRALECPHELHNGSWIRWGLPGKLLGAFLLAATTIITVLQIVWRVVPQFHHYSGVYAADATLELLASLLLLLKLLLNTVTLDSTNGMLVHTLWECLAPISALLINIIIGVGDLLRFAFTESTVGRLLQAFEIHILVVFVVVTALLTDHDIIPSVVSPQSNTRRDVAFTLPEPARQSTFRVTAPFIVTPHMSSDLDATTQNRESSRDVLRRSARRSLNYVSSWLSSMVSRNRLHYEDEGVVLWDRKEGNLNLPHIKSVNSDLRTGIVLLSQEPKGQEELVRDMPANRMSITSPSSLQSAPARSIKGSIHHDQTLHPHQVDVAQRMVPFHDQTSSVPIASALSSICSEAKYTGHPVTPPEASPVYGFGGVPPLPSVSASQISFDELLKQQSQLDQGIPTLKLFSTSPLSCNSVVNPKSVELTRSSSIGQRTVSSDVSLSNFPVPPWMTTPFPPLPSPRPSSIKRVLVDRRVRLAASRPTPVQDGSSPPPQETTESLVDIPNSPCSNSVLHSSREEKEYLFAQDGKSSPLGPSGTRYNATPFAGPSGNLSNDLEDLATSGEPVPEKSRCPTDSGTGVETIQLTGSATKHPPRTLPRQLKPASPAMTKLLPLAGFSRLAQDATADGVQHWINDQTSRSPTIVSSSQTPVLDHTGSVPPTRRHLIRESGSPVTVAVERSDLAQEMSARP